MTVERFKVQKNDQGVTLYPTNMLRWLHSKFEPFVLQQYWQGWHYGPEPGQSTEHGEWRDVPTVPHDAPT